MRALPSLPALPVLPVNNDYNVAIYTVQPICTNSMDVADSSGREVIVQHQIHSLEVNAPAHHIGAD